MELDPLSKKTCKFLFINLKGQNQFGGGLLCYTNQIIPCKTVTYIPYLQVLLKFYQ